MVLPVSPGLSQAVAFSWLCLHGQPLANLAAENEMFSPWLLHKVVLELLES